MVEKNSKGKKVGVKSVRAEDAGQTRSNSVPKKGRQNLSNGSQGQILHSNKSLKFKSSKSYNF